MKNLCSAMLSKYILFCIFYIRLTQNAPSPSKITHLNIDEFISQLMTSEKFNELADEIAERAALKFKSVEIQNVTTLRHNLDAVKPDRKHHNIIDKQQYARVEPRFKESETEDIDIIDKPENNKEESYSDRNLKKKNKIIKSYDDLSPKINKKDEKDAPKFGKIDTKSFLKHDGKSKELLYLNFKHITKERNLKTDKKNKKKTKDVQQSGENILSEHNDENDNDFSGQSKEKSRNLSKEEYVRKDMKMRINKKKYEVDRVSSQHSDEKGSQETPIQRNKKKNNNSDDLKEVKSDAHLEVDSDSKKSQKPALSENIDNNSDSLDLENQHEALEPTVSKENSEEDKKNTPKQIIDIAIKRALSAEDISVHRSEERTDSQKGPRIEPNIQPEIQGHSEPQEQPNITSNTSPKQLYRRERGKIYTFVSSPDYAEYHENLARLPENNVFINTY